MRPTFTEIVQEFTKYGFTQTPLNSGEIDRLIGLGMSRDDIYAIGCDCAAGFSLDDALEAHFRNLTP